MTDYILQLSLSWHAYSKPIYLIATFRIFLANFVNKLKFLLYHCYQLKVYVIDVCKCFSITFFINCKSQEFVKCVYCKQTSIFSRRMSNGGFQRCFVFNLTFRDLQNLYCSFDLFSHARQFLPCIFPLQFFSLISSPSVPTSIVF